jgi:multiple sugar transport system permease protein
VVPGATKSPTAASPLTAYLFLAPYLVLFGLFVLAPILYGLWISLHEWDFLLPGKPFVGLQNYIDLFTPGTTVSGPFWNSMRTTGIFILLSVPLVVVLPLLIAVLLARKFPGRDFFRAVIFAPYVLGVAVIGILWRYLLDPNVGVLASFLNRVGIDSPPWLTDTPWVWAALVVPTIWWTLGYNMVIFLAGLQDISRELYEAADMDGARPGPAVLQRHAARPAADHDLRGHHHPAGVREPVRPVLHHHAGPAGRGDPVGHHADRRGGPGPVQHGQLGGDEHDHDPVPAH